MTTIKSDRSAWWHDLANPELPDPLPIIPLRNAVLLPGGMLSITAGRPKTLALLNALPPGSASVGIVTQKASETEDPTLEDLHRVGTLAKIVKIQRVNEEALLMIVQGLIRFRVEGLLQAEPYWIAHTTRIEETERDTMEAGALSESLREVFRGLLDQLPQIPTAVADSLSDTDDPGLLADLVGAHLELSNTQRLEILSEANIPQRLRKTISMASKFREIVDVRKKIDAQVRSEFSKHQREAILRQQLKAIREELGEDEPGDEVEELQSRLDALDLPEEAAKAARREMDRLKRMSPQQADYHVARTYLEWMAELPWNMSTEDKIDLDNVSEVLDEGHHGMAKVKRRILEYLAIHRLNPDKKGPILCLVGPPGVGKTSLGTAIASAIGRKFVRASLGGVRDEAEIRGHRRTYVGALPGRIIAGLKRAQSNNPVFLLDEIDKLGVSMQGNPAAALLEVMDPEQNNTFSDHYLEVPFDLSKVMFIATANQLDPVPPALRDRMEILEVPSYSPFDKQIIARKYLLKKQIEDNGLKEDQLTMSDELLRRVIDNYTREAGVRRLEQQLAALCRAVALKIAGEEVDAVEMTEEFLVEVLGSPRYFPEVAERTQLPGVATGLAWTATGGDLLFIETTRMPGKGRLNLTGQLGDVMKESAQAALSYVRSNAAALGVAPNFLEVEDIHIHFPAGGIPKDGPSAGVTIFTALTSLLTGRRVRSDVAMTGEATLRGQVLPVGGIKEKVLAAHRGGVQRVILPARNEHDLRDLPEETKKAIEFIFVKEMHEALSAGLEPESSVDVPVTLEKLPPPEESPGPDAGARA